MKKNAASEKERINWSLKKIDWSMKKNKSAEQIVGEGEVSKNQKEKEKKKEKKPCWISNYLSGIVTGSIKTAVKEITEDEEARNRVKLLAKEIGDYLLQPYISEFKNYAIATGTTVFTVMQFKKFGLGPKCIKTIKTTMRKFW